jgi:hypothetical protein
MTPTDDEAMNDTLEALREIDRATLERAATELTMMAGRRADAVDDPPNVPGVFVLLARIAYVLAHEDKRG